MSEPDRPPVHESLKVIDHRTLLKRGRWWSEAVLVDSFGRKQIGLYLWLKTNGRWKRKQKFVIRNKENWQKVKEAVEDLLKRMEGEEE